MKRLFLLMALLAVLSCSREQQEIRRTLRSAGKNRNTLEKVLEYYERLEDEEKCQAAVYLVRNMCWHQSYCGDMESYRAMIDSLIPEMTSAYRYNHFIKSVFDSLNSQFHLKKDAKVITEDFLIANIEEAFKLWKEGRWARHLSFDDFCEYILPYKIAERQPLEEWRSEFESMYVGNEITVDDAVDEYRGEPHIALQNIRRDAIGNVLAYSDSLETTHLYDLRVLKDIPYGDCISLCELGLLLYRSKGIPVAMDFVPGWADRAGSHAWLSVLTRRGINKPVHAFSDGDPEDEVQCRRFAKVYRRTFQPNAELARRLEFGYPIPSRLSDIFFKDVTEEYVRCEDITIKAHHKILGKNIYVAIFDNLKWSPVDYGERRGIRKVSFHKLARNALYLPVLLKRNGKQIPIGNPFFIHSDGEVETITSPETHNNKMIITMTRKYPVYWLLAAVYDRTRGGSIQGSDSPIFSQPEMITEIPYSHNWSGFIPVTSKRAYRYYRFCAPEKAVCDLAELKMYSNTNYILPKRVFSTSEAMASNKTPENVIDNDALTWYTTDDKLGVWVGIDYGEPQYVTGVYYSVRSDGNDFYPGYEYVLRQWNGTTWKKLETFVGTKEVKHTFINLQEGSLYLITCNTTGTQSRPFLVNSGNVCWL